MNWKQALFLGGTVLLLAACADATAPKPGLRQVKGAAAVNSKNSGSTTTATTSCRSGYSLSVGQSDSTGACGVY
jgi:hypothetical protein